jgi:hypothetical protein
MKICGTDVEVYGRVLRVARLVAEKHQFVADPEPVIAGLRQSGRRVDLFTFIQQLPEAPPKYTYSMEWDNLAVISISTFEQWWNEQIGFKARNKAKQAEKKGVTLREVPFDENLVRGIWEIYNECPIRQGKPFGHYGKSLDTVRVEAGTFLDVSFFIGAFLDEKMVGFVKLTTDQSMVQAGLMHIVAMVQHRDKAVTNALVANAVRACAEREIGHLVYSNFAYGKKQQDSLSDFKERNGFKRINLPRYYVPLNSFGAFAFRAGLHHRLADRVPEAVAVKFRELRNSWYSRNRKLQSSTQFLQEQ